MIHTKTSALALFAVASATGADWEATARALASVLTPKAKAAPALAAGRPAVRCKSRALASKAWAGARVPVYQRQACGHTFNSAGCAVCMTCQAQRRAFPALALANPFAALELRDRVALECGEALLVGDWASMDKLAAVIRERDRARGKATEPQPYRRAA
jgi:hypothetical protein